SQMFVKNNLALSHYCKNQLDEAMTITEQVLFLEPRNIHALCNRVLFLLARGKQPHELQDLLQEIVVIPPADVDERIKVALTCCELREHELTYQYAQKILEELPYDERILFLAGAAAANTGRMSEALGYFMDMLKLCPENTVALFYKNRVQEAKDREIPTYVEYAYQVPPAELRRRMAYLNGCVQQGPDALLKLWQEDEYFGHMLLWGLTLADMTIKRLVIELVASFGDARATATLRRYLLRMHEPDETKNDAILALQRLHVPQPYVAYISGKVVEVRVGTLDRPGFKLRPGNEKVVELVLVSIGNTVGKQYLPGIVEVIGRYFASQPAMPIMRNVAAWAAAFIYVGTYLQDKQAADLGDIAEQLQAGRNSVRRCVGIIRSCMDGFFEEDHEKGEK
ncbi:MAG: hypothetical protein IJP03_01520, partial [Christensenellaceae bacterium]|nr:hypothetical protein [Christensenellaceae bacterium]